MSLTFGRIIGQGGYGAVYQAHFKKQRCAVKKFFLSESEVREDKDIMREIDLLKHLRHKHIIQFYKADYVDNKLVIIMEYAEQGSLQSLIKASPTRWADWPTKERIAQEIVRGLAYMHDEKILHRDLKSGNVLLTRHMEVKLCDFGLAVVKTATVSKSSDLSGGIQGTLRWMAPELLGGRPKYSTKSDIFALGVVMWEMAANCTLPFKHQSDHFVVIMAIKSGEREKLPDGTPTEYRQIVERCWEQDPANRPEAEDLLIVGEDGFASGSDTPNISSKGMASGIDAVSVTDTMDFGRLAAPPISSLSSKASASSSNIQITRNLAVASPPNSYEPNISNNYTTLVSFAVQPDGDYHGNGLPFQRQSLPSGLVEATDIASRGVKPARSGAQMDALLQQAEQGDPHSRFLLALMYCNGTDGCDRDIAVAAEWFRKAASQNHMMAQNHLAAMYETGHGVTANHQTALEWYTKAMRNGHPDAEKNIDRVRKIIQHGQASKHEIQAKHEQGALHRAREIAGLTEAKSSIPVSTPSVTTTNQTIQDERHSAREREMAALRNVRTPAVENPTTTSSTIHAIRAQAWQGDVQAGLDLAHMYFYGQHVEKNYTEAANWFRKLADRDHPQAQAMLAHQYLYGLGVTESKVNAFEYFNKAALQYHVEAMYQVAQMWQQGIGTHRDERLAIIWFEGAAKRGHEEARKQLASMTTASARMKRFFRLGK